MFQAQFESKLNQSNLHIYLDKPYEEDYQIPMLQKNPIVGILPEEVNTRIKQKGFKRWLLFMKRNQSNNKKFSYW